jgi:hypothetical protein
LKKLSMIALAAGIAAWAMSRGKKHEEEPAHEYAAPAMAGATPDTSPSGG